MYIPSHVCSLCILHLRDDLIPLIPISYDVPLRFLSRLDPLQEAELVRVGGPQKGSRVSTIPEMTKGQMAAKRSNRKKRNQEGDD